MPCSISSRPASRPLSSSGWWIVVSPAAAAAGTSSNPVTETSPGHVEPARAQRLDHAEREHVGRAQDRRRGRGQRQQLVGGALAALGEVGERLEDGHRVGAVQAGDVALDPLAADLAVAERDPLGAREALAVVVDEAVGDERDAAVAQLRDVCRGQPRALAIVDADEERAGQARLVHDHDRQAAVERRGDGRVRVGHAVEAERADDRVAHRHDLAALAAHPRQQQQLIALGLGGLREALEEADRARVGERVGEALGEHQADRAAQPGPQPPGGRVRARVAEALRRLQHLLAQPGGELVGTVVRIGDSRARDAQGVGDRLQRHPLCHRDRSTGSGDTRSANVSRTPARARRGRAAATGSSAGRTGAPGRAERAWDSISGARCTRIRGASGRILSGGEGTWGGSVSIQ